MLHLEKYVLNLSFVHNGFIVDIKKDSHTQFIRFFQIVERGVERLKKLKGALPQRQRIPESRKYTDTCKVQEIFKCRNARGSLCCVCLCVCVCQAYFPPFIVVWILFRYRTIFGRMIFCFTLFAFFVTLCGHSLKKEGMWGESERKREFVEGRLHCYGFQSVAVVDAVAICWLLFQYSMISMYIQQHSRRK